MDKTSPKIIAFHLPQFHPIEENDNWWGKGFTEWTNVAMARPLYKGHKQPKLPRDLGFYDLRLRESRELQASYARMAGVYGFCYWHYWFGHGRRLLEKPIDDMLEKNSPDFPFMLGWANQTWTGIWHGAKDRILIEQKYPGIDDVMAHCEVLARHFSDPRYIKIDEKPLLYIYDPYSTGFKKQYLDLYRTILSKRYNIDPYFIIKSTNFSDRKLQGIGDAYTAERLHIMRSQGHWSGGGLIDHIERLLPLLKKRGFEDGARNTRQIFTVDYRKAIDAIRLDEYSADQIPCIISNWDNTPRSGRDGWVAENSTPENFGIHLDHIFKAKRAGPFKNIYFLKSWNEWAEGNYIEPDQEYGTKFIDVLKNKIQNQSNR